MMSGMRVVERQFSDFLRQPNEVVAELEDHDVVLRRRNAPPLRLSQAARDQDRAEAFDTAARLLRNLVTHNVAAFNDAIDDVFAWTSFLPERDRRAFSAELTLSLVASAELDNYGAIAQLLREWRATAEIHADPKLAHRLSQPLQASGDPVTTPQA